MRHKKILILALVMAFIPVFTYAQGYAVSPSVVKSAAAPAAVAVVDEYSYIDRPFNSITSAVRVRTTSDNRNVIHNLTIRVSNRGTKNAGMSVNAFYCKIGTDECRRIPCDFPARDINMPSNTFFEVECITTQDTCAGYGTKIEYSMLGTQGSFVSDDVVSCPQSVCDQIGMSMIAPSLLTAGEDAIAEGYLKELGGEGVPSPIILLVGDRYTVRTDSNEFGYWRAPFTIDEPGYYQLVARSASCLRESKSIVQILPASAEKAAVMDFLVYPKNIDVETGGSALLVVENDRKDSVRFAISGVPAGWAEPPNFVLSNGIKFVYISPAATGTYTLTVSADNGFEKSITLYAAPKKTSVITAKTAKTDAAAALVGILLIFLLLFSKKLKTPDSRKTYLEGVRREIESAKAAQHQKSGFRLSTTVSD